MRGGFLKFVGSAPLELSIDRGFRSIGPLVCLGDPRFQRRTGRVARVFSRDEAWQQAVLALARVCDVTFIHYEPGGSIEWEMENFIDAPGRAVAFWMQQIESPRLGDISVFDRLPSLLVARLRRAGITAADVGKSDERSLLVMFANGRTFLSRPEPAGARLAGSIRNAIKLANLQPSFPDKKRGPRLGWLRFMERSPALFALAMPFLLLGAFALVQYQLDDPGRKAIAHLETGDAALASARFAAANAEYTAAMSVPGLNTNQLNAWLALREAFASRCITGALSDGDLALAKLDCAEAKRLARSDTTSEVNFAYIVLALREQDFEVAAARVRSALGEAPPGRYEPYQATKLYARGLVRCGLGQTENGQRDVAHATKMNAALPDVFAKLGVRCAAPTGPLPDPFWEPEPPKPTDSEPLPAIEGSAP